MVKNLLITILSLLSLQLSAKAGFGTLTYIFISDPVFTSATTATFIENGTGTAYTAIATDDNTITYSLGTSNDEALFDIVGTSGIVTFKTPPNFEAPSDANADNSYVIEVKANDGTNTAIQTIRLFVQNIVDENPVFTTIPITSIDENNKYNYLVAAKGQDGKQSTITGNGIPAWLSLETKTHFVSTLAGSGKEKNVDGVGAAASFHFITHLSTDKAGNIYTTNLGNHTVRKVTPIGAVTTIAGFDNGGTRVNANGTNASFGGANKAIYDDFSKNIYVLDGSMVRKIDQNGDVSDFAGSGFFGFIDGTGTAARFNPLIGGDVDKFGNLYVADFGNHAIRKITPEGVVTTIAGNGSASYLDATGTAAGFNRPFDLTLDAAGNIYVSDEGNDRIRKIDTEGRVTTVAGSGTEAFADGTGVAASFFNPRGIDVDANNNLYVADGNNNRVRKVSPSGVVTTVAGSGALQFLDGDGTEAAIRDPWGLALHGDIIYVTSVFGRVRKISTQYALTGDPAGKVGTHYAGLRATDGNGNIKIQEFSILVNDGTIPYFTSNPIQEIRDNQKYEYKILATDPDGDPINITGRLLPPWLKLVERIEHRVTTMAGNGTFGKSDGVGIEAGFTNPSGIAINSSGDMFVADLEGHVIRKITSAGIVSTFVGSGINGFLDGAGLGAQFDGPRGLAFDSNDNLYVADTRNHRIRRVTPEGLVSTIAGSTVGYLDGNGHDSKFNSPSDLTIDSNNNIYVSDGGNHRIRKIDAAGNVTTIAGSGQFGYLDGNGAGAEFNTPWGIAVDDNGNLYVAGHGDHTIRKITPSGDVSTLAGSGVSGFKDGTGADATFKNPAGLTLGNDGNLYVVDPETNSLRRITLNGVVSTIAGGDGVGFTNGIGRSATFRSTTDIEMDSFGNLFVADQFNHAIRKISGSGTFLEGNASKEIANGNITLKVDDGKGNSSEQFFRVTVKDVTAPLFTSPMSTSVIEGSSLPAYQATVKDFGTITYTLSPEKDGTRFNLNSKSGLLRFNTVPDFENPIDDNTDNVYLVDINASDGINRAILSVSITVINSSNEEALSFLSNPVTSISRDDQYSYLIETSSKSATITTTNLPTWLGLKEIAEVTSTKGAGVAITQDTNGDFYVLSNNQVKKIDQTGNITVVAGSGDYGFADGTGLAASFASPSGITLGPDGNLYVADTRNSRIRKVTKSGVVTTHAGAGPNGFDVIDGVAAVATFIDPIDLVFDSQGNLFVSDNRSHSIRKISLDGEVITFAGQGEKLFIDRGTGPSLIDLKGGFAEGAGLSAKFNRPGRMVIDKDDNILVSDLSNNRIRKISPTGIVTTLAGSVEGYVDGPISSAQFNGPNNIAIKEDGTLFIAEGGRIRMINTQGVVSTIAGLRLGNSGPIDGFGTEARFDGISDMIQGKDGQLYVPNDYNGILRKLSLIQVLQGNPFNETGQHNVSLTATESNGQSATQNFTLEVKDLANPLIREIVRINPVEKTIKAKSVSFRIKFSEKVLNVDHHDFQLSAGGSRGFVTSVTEDPFEDSVYYINVSFISGTGLVDLRVVSGTDITDLQGNKLSNLEPTEIEEVYNIIGNNSPQISSDPVLEVNDDQSYSYPLTITDSDYDLLSFNSSVFPSWLSLNTERGVSTLAGSNIGYQDGIGQNAQFQTILHLTTDRFGNSYVTESGKKRIRKITPNGQVSTFISLTGRIQLPGGSVSGTSLEPTALVVDHLGNLIVAGFYSAPSESYFRIERISSRGDRQVIAGGPGLELVNGQGKLATFNSIGGLAIDSNGNIIVSDEGNHLIRKVTQDGSVTTIAGSSKGFQDGPSGQAKFSNPKALAIDTDGNIFVTDFHNHKVRKIDVGGNVSTLAGSEYGYQDGNGSSAKFSGLFAMTIDAQNNLIVSDNNNNRIRQIDQAGNVTTLAGSTYGFEDGLAVSSKFKNVIGIAMDNAGNIIVVDTDNSRLRKISKIYSLQGSAIGQTGSHSVSLVTSDNFGGSDTQSFSINVKNATPPVFSSGITQSFVENTTGTVYSIAATDVNAVTYSLGTDNDEAFFNLNGDVVTFKAIPDFEVKSSYVIEVRANDGLNTASQDVVITIIDVDEVLPVFTSAATVSFAENGTGTAYTIVATDANAINYSLGTSNDETLFNIVGTTGEVTFKTSPDFETPTDTNADNDYLIEVKASDGVNIASLAVTVSVLNINEAPIFTSSPPLRVNDNQTYNYEVNAFNPAGSPVIITAETLPNWLTFQSSGEVTTLAGGKPSSIKDGLGLAASFLTPGGSTLDADGNLLIADTGNNRIAKISPTGDVTNFAGTGIGGFLNGSRESAQFSAPVGLVFDSQGNLFVADAGNSRIRKIDQAGQVTTFAGSDQFGAIDGTGANASFRLLTAIAIDNQDNLYVADRFSVRKISPNGDVTLFAGDPSSFGTTNGSSTVARFGPIGGLIVDNSGIIYVSERFFNTIRRVTSDGVVSTLAGKNTAGFDDGTSASASFSAPYGLTLGPDGHLYLADAGNSAIRKISLEGVVSTFLGTNGELSNVYKSVRGLQFNSSGELMTVDYESGLVHKITASKEVTPFAGGTRTGFDDGLGSQANFDSPFDVVTDEKGNTYVSDQKNNAIRKIDINGVVSTIAGTGEVGAEDGPGNQATFNSPLGIGLDKAGNIYVADFGNRLIRKISPNGVVSTIAGNGVKGYADGEASHASFRSPVDVVATEDGTVYVADEQDHRIRKISKAGMVSTFAGTGVIGNSVDGNGTLASIPHPRSIAADEDGNLYVIEGLQSFIRKIDPEANVTTIIDNSENKLVDQQNNDFNLVLPSGLAINSQGHFFVADRTKHTIVKIEGLIATVLAGSENRGSTNGIGSNSGFNNPSGVAIDPKENIIVADLLNHRIRRVTAGKNLLSGSAVGQSGTHAVVLKATDEVGNAINQSFEIEIIDATSPVFTSSKAVNFAENGTGTAYTIAATDASAVAYSLGTSNDEALFDISGDKISFKASPDFEVPKDSDAKNTYLLEVIAKDALGNSASQQVTITVTDADEVAPTVILSSNSSALVFRPGFKVTFTFSEPVTGFEVSDLTITNGSVSAFTGSGSTYSALITATVDGQVTVLVGQDKAVDASGNKNLASNTITRIVEATNVAPSAVDLSANTISENTAPPTEVGTLSAVDSDESDKHAFALVDGEGATNNGQFRIINDRLIAKAAFDYETTNTTSVRIRATDARGLSFDAIKQIEILNVAEPQITVFLPSIADPLIGDPNLAFEAIRTGQTATRTIEVTNSGSDRALSITDITLPAGFTIDKTTVSIAQGAKEVLTVTFSPTEEKIYAGSIVISSNAGEKKVQTGGRGKKNRAPIAVSPNAEVFFKLSDLLKLRGYDPDGDAIEFVITQQPQHGRVTAAAGGLYSFTPNNLTPGQIYQDVLKFKVVETGGGLESAEAELKFKFKVRDQAHSINSLAVNSKTDEKLVFDLKFSDPVLNDAYQLKVSYYDLSDPTSPVFVPLLNQNVAKSGITTTDGVHGFAFETASSGHSYLFSASRVFMSLELTTANGYSASDGYILRNEGSGASIGAIEGAGSDDGEFFVFASQSSVPENESVEVNLYAVELGSFSLSESTIAITKSALKGTSTSPVEVKKTDNLAQWKLTYASDTEIGLLDSLQFTVTHPERSADADAYAKVEVIEVADAPVLEVIADQQTNEEETITLDLVVSDPDSELTITATSSESSNVPVTVSDNKLTITPGKDFNGTANISVLVTESNSESALSTFDEFQLTVVPVNDKPLMTAISDLTVAEDGQVVVTLSATDVDADLPIFTYAASTDDQDNVSYTLEGDVLTITPAANYNGTIAFGVTANDGEGTSNSISASEAFTVTVNAVNDAPTSSATINTQTLLEAIPAYTLDLTQYFTDIETAAKDLTYTVSSINNAGLSISGATLTISSVAGASGVEVATVTASDGELSVSQSVTFVATTASSEVTVANAVADQVLVEDFGLTSIDLSSVFALSTDANASFTYVLTGNNTIGASMNGSLLELTSVADFNGADELIIIGTADSKSSFTSFKITVNPANDAPNLVTAISDVDTPEDAGLSQVISANAFSDVDGDVLTYSASYTAGWLSFDAATRTFSGTPANADVGTVAVTVTATDPSGAVATDSFNIVVSNTNDEPTAITFTSKLLDENIALSSVVSDLTSVDPDAGDDSFTYTLVSGTGDTDNSNFAIVGNELLTASAFDFESKASYSIRIKTTDGFEGSFTEAVTLTVNNVNEVATDLDLPVTVIAENQTAGSIISTLTTTDPDAGDSHNYSLVSGAGDADNSSFTITNGELTTASAFDFETKSSYAVRVKTTDAGGLSFEKAFTVTVTNVNEVATDVNLSAATIAENASISAEIADLSTTDPDAGDTHAYSLATGEGDADNANFKIEDAKLLAASSFNFENRSNYSVRLKSTDAVGLSFEKSFTITVTDINDAPSGITADNLAIEENQDSGTTIGSLTTTDQDNGDTHSYSFVAGEGDADNASFTLDGNLLKSAASYDFETKDNYALRIKTTDAGGLSFETAMTVAITNQAEAQMRVENNDNLDPTALGTTATFNITVFNDGDGAMNVTGITYPEGFSGASGISEIAASGSTELTVSFSPTEAKTYSGNIVLTYNGGEQAVAVSALGEIVTAIDDGLIDEALITMYPNPATNEFTLDLTSFNGQPIKISIVNGSGLGVYAAHDIRSSKHTVRVGNYSQGIYIVVLQSGKQLIQKKLIIRR